MLYIVAKLQSFPYRPFFSSRRHFLGIRSDIRRKKILEYPIRYQISDVTFCPDIRYPVILRCIPSYNCLFPSVKIVLNLLNYKKIIHTCNKLITVNKRNNLLLRYTKKS